MTFPLSLLKRENDDLNPLPLSRERDRVGSGFFRGVNLVAFELCEVAPAVGGTHALAVLTAIATFLLRQTNQIYLL